MSGSLFASLKDRAKERRRVEPTEVFPTDELRRGFDHRDPRIDRFTEGTHSEQDSLHGNPDPDIGRKTRMQDSGAVANGGVQFLSLCFANGSMSTCHQMRYAQDMILTDVTQAPSGV
jgi:hypothetical protein